jgi:hypothetical protein
MELKATQPRKFQQPAQIDYSATVSHFAYRALTHADLPGEFGL